MLKVINNTQTHPIILFIDNVGKVTHGPSQILRTQCDTPRKHNILSDWTVETMAMSSVLWLLALLVFMVKKVRSFHVS
jgi:hypothetical protein